MFNFKKDFDFSKVLLIILIIVILSAAVISIKIAFVRMNDWKLPPKPIQLIKPTSPSDPSLAPPASIPLPTNNPANPETPDPNGAEKSPEYTNAIKFLGNLIKEMLTHPAFYEVMSAMILFPVIVKTVVYMVRLGVAQTVRYAAIKALSFLEPVILGLAEIFGIEGLKKFGIYLSETVIKDLAERSVIYVSETAAEKVGIDLAEKSALALVKSASGMEIAEAAAAFAGPIGWAFDMLQLGGMVSDMIDNKWLHIYSDMQQNQALNVVKEKTYNAVGYALKGLKNPLQQRPSKGPLYDVYKSDSKLDPKDPKSQANIIIQCYTNSVYNIMNSPLFIDAYQRALDTDGKYSYSDIEIQRFMTRHLNPEIVLRYCSEIQCEKYGGVSVRLSGDCTFKDYDTCLKSNITYPPQEGEVYVEWDLNRKECSMAPTTIKDICIAKNVGKENDTSVNGDDGIAYDPKTGLCNITPYYCKNRGGQNYTEDNGYPDCYVSGFQSFWENVFGKDIVRGLTRTYDNINSGFTKGTVIRKITPTPTPTS